MTNQYTVDGEFENSNETNLNNKYENAMDSVDVIDKDKPMLSFEQIKDRFNDLISQNNDISGEISSNIKLIDINEDSADMVANTIHEIEMACNKKSMTEKMVNLLPNVVKKKVNHMRKHTDIAINKQKSVAELASKHFDTLSEKRDGLTANLESIYKIRDKLDVSTEQLSDMQGDLKTRILYLEEASNVKGKAADSRIEQLKAKEMIVQVQSQYLTQKDLENQINVVQYVAEQLVESINAALPSIKSNFIDQISINAGLNQMKELKESVDMTRRMTLELQQQAFNDTKEIMSEISKSGVGFTEEEMNMIEKLNKEKQVFQNKMRSDFYKNEDTKTKQIKRLNKMIEEQESFFSPKSIVQQNELLENDQKNN